VKQRSRTRTLIAVAMLSIAAALSAQATPPAPNSTANRIGRLTSMGNGGMQTFYQYDDLACAIAHKPSTPHFNEEPFPSTAGLDASTQSDGLPRARSNDASRRDFYDSSTTNQVLEEQP